jgi:hypothetical protein
MTSENLIIIVADTMRHLDILAGDRPAELQRVMPTLSRMVRDGVSLQDMWASSSWTAPSFLSLLSGFRPWRLHTELANSKDVAQELSVLPRAWRDLGGESLCLSANILISPTGGMINGFDAFNPGLLDLPMRTFRVGSAFLDSLRFPSGSTRVKSRSASGVSAPVHGETAFLESVAQVYHRAGSGFTKGDRLRSSLSHFLRRREQERPLFLLVDLMEAHEPYLEDLNQRPIGMTGLSRATCNLCYYHRSHSIKNSDPPTFSDGYQHALRHLDSEVSQMLTILSDSGILSNSTVILTSDHGQSLGEHGLFGHAAHLYDELVRVPCVIWKGKDASPLRHASAIQIPRFDHTHLHRALCDLMRKDSDHDVINSLSEAISKEPLTGAFYNGWRPLRKGSAPFGPPRSVIRLAEGSESVFLELEHHGVVPVEGRVDNPAQGKLYKLAEEFLVKDSLALRKSGNIPIDAGVDDRLKSWGYA